MCDNLIYGGLDCVVYVDFNDEYDDDDVYYDDLDCVDCDDFDDFVNVVYVKIVYDNFVYVNFVYADLHCVVYVDYTDDLR